MKKPNYVFDDELYHHGIPGQKWGERRFQNEDGSWTPEGRERYGKGENPYQKAKATYKLKEYKSGLESKQRLRADRIAAKEERHRIKELAKTQKLAKKEQAKIDREQAKQDRKVRDPATLKNKLLRTKHYSMSDEELQNTINRLKLEAEYNKSYILATHQSKALVKADRFFDGPTGRFVADLAVRTLPDLVKSMATKALDKDKGLSDLEKREKESVIRKNNAEALSKESIAWNTNSKLMNDKYDYEWVTDPNNKNVKLKYKRK